MYDILTSRCLPGYQTTTSNKSQESLQRSSWDRYQKHCQKRDDEMPNVRHNAFVSRKKQNDIHDILLVLKC